MSTEVILEVEGSSALGKSTSPAEELSARPFWMDTEDSRDADEAEMNEFAQTFFRLSTVDDRQYGCPWPYRNTNQPADAQTKKAYQRVSVRLFNRALREISAR